MAVTAIPQFSLDGAAFTEAEINNILKTLTNALIDAISNTESGIYNYTIGTKKVDKSTFMGSVKELIVLFEAKKNAIPKEETLATDYIIDDYGRDMSEYIDEDF